MCILNANMTKRYIYTRTVIICNIIIIFALFVIILNKFIFWYNIYIVIAHVLCVHTHWVHIYMYIHAYIIF